VTSQLGTGKQQTFFTVYCCTFSRNQNGQFVGLTADGEDLVEVVSEVSAWGLINYTDANSKCRHLKILTCKGTSRQVFIRVYRLELQ
jgi:hypothetical protein